jgi:hypothetical protein
VREEQRVLGARGADARSERHLALLRAGGGVDQHEQRRPARVGHGRGAGEQPEVAAVGGHAHLREVGMLGERQVAVVRLEVHPGDLDAELAGHVLDRRLHAVGLGHDLPERVEHALALHVLARVGAEGVEQVVLVDELAARVDRRAAEAGRRAPPVGELAVDRARLALLRLPGRAPAREIRADDDRGPLASRYLGAEHRQARVVACGEGRRAREHEHGRDRRSPPPGR